MARAGGSGVGDCRHRRRPQFRPRRGRCDRRTHPQAAERRARADAPHHAPRHRARRRHRHTRPAAGRNARRGVQLRHEPADAPQLQRPGRAEHPVPCGRRASGRRNHGRRGLLASGHGQRGPHRDSEGRLVGPVRQQCRRRRDQHHHPQGCQALAPDGRSTTSSVTTSPSRPEAARSATC